MTPSPHRRQSRGENDRELDRVMGAIDDSMRKRSTADKNRDTYMAHSSTRSPQRRGRYDSTQTRTTRSPLSTRPRASPTRAPLAMDETAVPEHADSVVPLRQFLRHIDNMYWWDQRVRLQIEQQRRESVGNIDAQVTGSPQLDPRSELLAARRNEGPLPERAMQLCREKLEAAQEKRAAEERRAAEEQERLAVRAGLPSSERMRDLVYSTKRDQELDELRQKDEEEHSRNCPFHPSLNPTSAQLTGSGRPGSTFQQLFPAPAQPYLSPPRSQSPKSSPSPYIRSSPAHVLAMERRMASRLLTPTYHAQKAPTANTLFDGASSRSSWTEGVEPVVLSESESIEFMELLHAIQEEKAAIPVSPVPPIHLDKLPVTTESKEPPQKKKPRKVRQRPQKTPQTGRAARAVKTPVARERPAPPTDGGLTPEELAELAALEAELGFL